MAWWLIDGVFNSEMHSAPSPHLELLIVRLVEELNQDARFPHLVISRLRASLEYVQAHRGSWIAPERLTSFEETVRNLLAYVVLALTEGQDDESELVNSLARCWPELPTILAIRAASARRKKKRSSSALSDNLVLNLPERLRKWTEGSVGLVDFNVFDDDPLGIKYRHLPPLNFEQQFGMAPRPSPARAAAGRDSIPPRA